MIRDSYPDTSRDRPSLTRSPAQGSSSREWNARASWPRRGCRRSGRTVRRTTRTCCCAPSSAANVGTDKDSEKRQRHAIQGFAEGQERCSVVRDFCGHGLGRIFHALPNIVHYGKPGHGIGLKPGMFFTVEPMINLGGYGVKVLSDGWTAVTRDRSLSAQFEHSVGVTENGVEIFTRSPKGLDRPPYDV